MRLLDMLPSQESWSVIDPTKLSEYLTCPRKYFFAHVLGWRPEYKSNHFTFGSAWHLAMEHLLLNNYTSEALEEAKYLFYHAYRQELNSESDDRCAPKDPHNGLASLDAYAKRFRSDSERYRVLGTEILGVMLLAPDAPMYGKLDALLEDTRDHKVICLDHKTSQRKMTFWAEQWLMSTQMLSYLHLLYCLYGYDTQSVGGVRIRCAFFYKAKPTEFDETLIEKSADQMSAWLDSTYTWYRTLKLDEQTLLEDDNTEHATMRAFPMNEKSCFNYGTQCQYFDYCSSWSNPLRRCAEAPIGFKVEFWDPRSDPKVKSTLDLTKEKADGEVLA